MRLPTAGLAVLLFAPAAGDEYRLIGLNRPGEMSLATPAVAGDALFVRTATKLCRISTSDAP
jgi:hypothetical protein